MKHFVAIGCLICVSCETVVEIPVPQFDPQLVVTSHFSPDSVWSVSLHRSLSVNARLDPSAQFVDVASVTILGDNGIAESLIHHGNGLYRSVDRRQPIAGIRYRLHVESPDGLEVRAASSAPLPPRITHSSLDLVAMDDSSSRFPTNTYRLSIRFADPPIEENFYRVGLYSYRSTYSDGSAPDSAYRSATVYAPAFGWFCGFSDALDGSSGYASVADTCDSFVVTDRLFDGEEYSWAGNIDLNVSPEMPHKERLLLVVSSLSRDYFEYQRTLMDNIMTGPFVEPVPVYTNIEGGVGVFAGYSNANINVHLPECLITVNYFGGHRQVISCED